MRPARAAVGVATGKRAIAAFGSGSKPGLGEPSPPCTSIHVGCFTVYHREMAGLRR